MVQDYSWAGSNVHVAVTRIITMRAVQYHYGCKRLHIILLYTTCGYRHQCKHGPFPYVVATREIYYNIYIGHLLCLYTYLLLCTFTNFTIIIILNRYLNDNVIVHFIYTILSRRYNNIWAYYYRYCFPSSAVWGRR